MIKFKLFKFKKMLNIFKIPGNQIIHADNMKYPSLMNLSQRCEPKNPAAPVISTRPHFPFWEEFDVYLYLYLWP